RVQDKAHAVDHENPCEEEVPCATHGQPLRARDRGPRGEPPHGGLAVHLRHAEPAGGIEAMRAELRDPVQLSIVTLRGAQTQPRPIERRTLAPIQRRVRVEDLQAAAQQDQQADRVDPVHDPERQRVPIDHAAQCSRRRHCGGRRRHRIFGNAGHARWHSDDSDELTLNCIRWTVPRGYIPRVAGDMLPGCPSTIRRRGAAGEPPCPSKANVLRSPARSVRSELPWCRPHWKRAPRLRRSTVPTRRPASISAMQNVLVASISPTPCRRKPPSTTLPRRWVDWMRWSTSPARFGSKRWPTAARKRSTSCIASTCAP